ncbi:MAG: outer membrane protein assembly factor BamA, partial [Candidatus Omnitrophica bacterium]|nr:outer membrane protein assembly factor BamA [Candidatus Omnitrophota bacterium]
GFIDVSAKYSVEYLRKGFVALDIDIKEGKRYSVGRVDISGNDVISANEVKKIMAEISEGGTFSREKLSVDLSNIRTLYFDRGYIFANVSETTSIDPETGKVDVKVNVEEGGLAYINKVKVQGNTRTRDSVIRRELRMYPGDRFDGGKLRRSKERLSNLGYFEDVSFDIEDTDTSDRKDLVVQVKETKTGTFSFGGGFSTVDRVVGFIEVEQKNFDFTNWPTFTGGGQKLTLRAETGSTKNNLLLSFTEPSIFDHPVAGGFDVFKREREREEDTGYAYDESRLGGDLRFAKEFSEYVTGGVTYKFENITIDNFADSITATDEIRQEEGTNSISSLGFSLGRDTRDNVFSTTKGLNLYSNLDFAGSVLGGSKDFWRLKTGGDYYVPFKFGSVVQFSLRSGLMSPYGDSDRIPVYERFFAGGAYSIRGYNERRVGPMTTGNQPVGGEAMIVGNIEYTIPLLDFLKFATFIDTGNVWSDMEDFASTGFKSGMGVGLRVKTPVGPINLDYGYPLNEEPGEDEKTGKFYFSVSRGF